MLAETGNFFFVGVIYLNRANARDFSCYVCCNSIVQVVNEVVTALAESGWSETIQYCDAEFCEQLRDECLADLQQIPLHQAAVGKGNERGVHETIRNDVTHWLTTASRAPQQLRYAEMMEQLRLKMNEQCFLGLFDFESHFALYPSGGFYKAHRDQHAGASNRVVTVILYLNENWQPGDGGELRIWTTPGAAKGPSVLIEPRMGTLVYFLANDYWHEVMVSNKPRMSITGWFLRS